TPDAEEGRKSRGVRSSRRSRRGLTERILTLLKRAWSRNGLILPCWVVSALALAACVAIAQDHAHPVALPAFALSDPVMAGLNQRLDWEADLSPADGAVFLRKVYLAGLSDKRPSADAIEALTRSYAVEPLGPDATYWRLTYVFNHWSDMPKPLRKAAADELKTAFPRHGWAM
ncbi:hypothetical protein LTR94_028986, partial [Friedmanniomyces endolithicus]